MYYHHLDLDLQFYSNTEDTDLNHLLFVDLHKDHNTENQWK